MGFFWGYNKNIGNNHFGTSAVWSSNQPRKTNKKNTTTSAPASRWNREASGTSCGGGRGSSTAAKPTSASWIRRN